MNRDKWNLVKAFLIELVVYAVLITAYFFLVLHFLGDLLLQLFNEKGRVVYAFTALVLIIAQGFVLEILTRTILGLVRGKGKKE